jgi:LysM repeat protein
MVRLRIILVVMIALLSACSITSKDESEPTAQLIVRTVTVSAPTAVVSPSATSGLNPTPTQGSLAQPTSAAPPVVTNCTVRTDWPVYTVQSGDTLGVIAGRTGSTISALTTANCLANPDSIAVGQQLRVPQLASGSTTSGSTTTGSTTTGSTTSGSTTSGSTSSGSSTSGGTTSGAPHFTSTLQIRPVINDQTLGLVAAQATIALDIGVVNDADAVRFYAGLTATDASPVNIATDDTPYDGTSVTYTFNSFDDKLFFWAIAQNEFGTTRSASVGVTFDPTYGQTSGGSITVGPSIGFDGGLYTLQYGASVTVSWTAAPTSATRIDFYLTPGGTGATPSLIGTDSNPSNGASLAWTVPQWVLGQLTATAFFPDGRTQNSLAVNVYSEGEGGRPSN